MCFLWIGGEAGELCGVHYRSGRSGLASQPQVAQSQQGAWFHHILQAGLSQAAEKAHLKEVQAPVSQIKGRRQTCVRQNKQLSGQDSFDWNS